MVTVHFAPSSRDGGISPVSVARAPCPLTECEPKIAFRSSAREAQAQHCCVSATSIGLRVLLSCSFGLGLVPLHCPFISSHSRIHPYEPLRSGCRLLPNLMLAHVSCLGTECELVARPSAKNTAPGRLSLAQATNFWHRRRNSARLMRIGGSPTFPRAWLAQNSLMRSSRKSVTFQWLLKAEAAALSLPPIDS